MNQLKNKIDFKAFNGAINKTDKKKISGSPLILSHRDNMSVWPLRIITFFWLDIRPKTQYNDLKR